MYLFIKRSLWGSRDRELSVKIVCHQELGLAALTNLPNRARWSEDVAHRGNQAV
jgi:hypothetical protein